MINRNKLEHILEYAKQQRHIGQYCKVPPEDMVEIMERLLNAGNSPVIPDTWIPVSERMPENKPGSYEYLVFEKLNNRVNHDYWNVPDAGDDTFTPFWNHYGEYVTHWMPLPAAPQEVK